MSKVRLTPCVDVIKEGYCWIKRNEKGVLDETPHRCIHFAEDIIHCNFIIVAALLEYLDPLGENTVALLR